MACPIATYNIPIPLLLIRCCRCHHLHLTPVNTTQTCPHCHCTCLVPCANQLLSILPYRVAPRCTCTRFHLQYTLHWRCWACDGTNNYERGSTNACSSCKYPRVKGGCEVWKSWWRSHDWESVWREIENERTVGLWAARLEALVGSEAAFMERLVRRREKEEEGGGNGGISGN